MGIPKQQTVAMVVNADTVIGVRDLKSVRKLRENRCSDIDRPEE
jgi:hypothetical protein